MAAVLSNYKHEAINGSNRHQMAVNDKTDFSIEKSRCTLEPEKLSKEVSNADSPSH